MRAAAAAGREVFGYNRSIDAVQAAKFDGFDATENLDKALARAAESNALIVLSVPVPALPVLAVFAGVTPVALWEAVRARRPIAAIRHELTHLVTLEACAPRARHRRMALPPTSLPALDPRRRWAAARAAPARAQRAPVASRGAVAPALRLQGRTAMAALSHGARIRRAPRGVA